MTSKFIHFPNNLKYLRLKAGLTAKQLADKCGVNMATIYTLQHHCGSPTVKTAIKLADFFKLSLDSLIFKDMRE